MQAEISCPRPLVVRCGAFGDMVLLTALIRVLHARFGCPVDILTSGPWSEPLLRGQPGVGEIWSVRSRKTPYWLAPDQRRVVRRLRARGAGPTWFCDGNDAVRPLLARAGIADEYIVDVRDHPLLPGEHATQQWRRLGADHAGGERARRGTRNPSRSAAGCYLQVSEQQRADLEAWLRARGARCGSVDPDPDRQQAHHAARAAPARGQPQVLAERALGEVIRHLRAHRPDHRIVLLGTGPEYAVESRASRRCAGVDGVYNAADDLPIPRLVALLARAAGLDHGRFGSGACRRGGGLSRRSCCSARRCRRCTGPGERRART